MSEAPSFFGPWFPSYPTTRVRGNFMRFVFPECAYAPVIPGWSLYESRTVSANKVYYIFKKVNSD